ncbi:MAG: hypothetical protein J1E02_08620 [Coprobacter sp.]|nr:hypothetical protein [Coprobacter sp.]
MKQYSGIISGRYEKCIGNKSVAVQIKDENFTLYSLEELFQHTGIDGESYLRIYQVQGVVKTLPEIELFEPEDRALLEQSLAIGEGPESILFIRKGEESGRLYLFHTDIGYIEELDVDLDSLIKQIEA